ncbi:MAG: FitA-like ribbon-helix-helix domain-containing protein [Steroidobacteraceae bacterium]
MGVAITVRDVPDDVRDELAARAARAGKSLQEYLRAMLVDATSRPSVGDVIARARARVDATGVNGHWFLPIRGHLFSPLMAMFSPHGWPRISPPTEVDFGASQVSGWTPFPAVAWARR